MTRKAFEFTKRSGQSEPQFQQEVVQPAASMAASSFTNAQKADMAGGIIDAVKDISVAVASVFEKHEVTKQAREHTRRVELETRASMHEQEQLTERLKTEQEGETNRLKMQTYQELQRLHKELTQFREQLAADQEDALRAHAKEMDILDTFQQSLDTVRKAYEFCSQEVLDAYKRDEQPPQGLTERLRETETSLVNLTRELAALR